MAEPIRLLFGTHPHPRDRNTLTPENTGWLAMLRDQLTTAPVGSAIAIWLEQGIYGAFLAHDYAGIVELSRALATEHDLSEADVLTAIANHDVNCPILDLIEPTFRGIEAQELQRTVHGSLDLLENIGGLEQQILELARIAEQQKRVVVRYEHPPFVAWTLWMSMTVLEHRLRTPAIGPRETNIYQQRYVGHNARLMRARDETFASQLSSSWNSEPTTTHLVLRGSEHKVALTRELKSRAVPFLVFRCDAVIVTRNTFTED